MNNDNYNNENINNLLDFTDELNKMNELSNELDKLFSSQENIIGKDNLDDNLDIFSQIIFNYKYDKELERGNIEYKRTLETYDENDKTVKLIRQIYWRIYEGIVSSNKEYCYYIIGIEDSGHPSFLKKSELFKSLNFISKSVLDTNLTFSCILVKNTMLNYDYFIVKFWTTDTEIIDYF